ncbi:MAG: DUF6261 family protein [Tannerellaceae bacterium]|jgi:hypothetical protein|nr:DUF6261 family protein [Tannerellaceae bacterium]
MLEIEIFSTLIAKLSVSDHFEFAYDIHTRLESEITQIPTLVVPWNKFSDAFRREDEAFKRPKLIETKQVVDLDANRLSLVVGISDIIKMRLKSTTPAEQAAADLLDTEILQTYKHVARLNYESKTSYITNMIQDFQSNKHKGAVVTLNLQPLLNELAAANTAFNKKFNERADEYLQQKGVGTATEARHETNETFKALVTALQSLYEANELSTSDPALRSKYEKCGFIINSVILHAKKTFSHNKGHEDDENEGTGGGGIG